MSKAGIDLLRFARRCAASFLLVIFTVPVLIAVIVAFSPPQLVFGSSGQLVGVPRGFTLQNFVTAWGRTDAGHSVFVSFALSAIVGLIVAMWGMAIISSVVGLSTRGRSSILSLLIAVKILPPICLCTPIFVAGALFGLAPTTLFVISMSVLLVPLFAWLLGPAIDAFVKEWLDVPRLFGLGSFGSTLLVFMPLALGIFVMVTGAVAVTAWNEGFFSSALGVQTIIPAIPSLVSHRGTDWGAVMALGLISSGPGIALTVLVGVYRLGQD